ncbi:MAG: RNA polymerase sigma factor [Balneolales bacterium]
MTFDREILDRLYRYCFVLTGQREDAEDLLHSALESYIRNRPDKIDYPVAYIRRIARNRYYDQLRKQKVLPFESLEESGSYTNVEQNLENIIIDRLTVEKIWKTLSSVEREVIYLWAVEEMSAAEIGQHLDQPRGTVLSRLYRLRRRVTENFSKEIGGEHHG